MLEKAEFRKLAEMKKSADMTLQIHYLRQYCHFVFRYAKRLDFTHQGGRGNNTASIVSDAINWENDKRNHRNLN